MRYLISLFVFVLSVAYIYYYRVTYAYTKRGDLNMNYEAIFSYLLVYLTDALFVSFAHNLTI